MSDKLKNLITVSLTGAFFLVLFIWAIFKPADQMSQTERRPLAQMPKFNAETILSGKFMSGFEKYATDQFPERDFFRGIKIFAAANVFRNKDVNKYYQSGGYISKIEYPLNIDSIKNATGLFNKILLLNKKPDTKFYFSLIPDKNYYLADKSGALHFDYEQLFDLLKEQTKLMEYIDIKGLLSVEDFYKTDTHWRQECIKDVAEKLAESMGATLSDTFREETFREDFKGVYASQSGFKTQGEKLNYLTSDLLESVTVYSDPNGKKTISMYDEEKGASDDGYEFFLSGSNAYLRIVNPNATTTRKLYIFRDSFGCSLAPLLVSGYAETILVDIRSLPSQMVGNYVDFTNSDVLFIYSSMILNNSSTLK